MRGLEREQQTGSCAGRIKGDGIETGAEPDRAITKAEFDTGANHVITIRAIKARRRVHAEQVADIKFDFLVAAANEQLGAFANAHADTGRDAIFLANRAITDVVVAFCADKQRLTDGEIDPGDNAVDATIIVWQASPEIVNTGRRTDINFGAVIRLCVGSRRKGYRAHRCERGECDFPHAFYPFVL